LAIFFLENSAAAKLISPEDIPKSVREEIITIKLVAAERIPKSSMLKALATITVKTNPKKAANKLPPNKIYVSLAVPDLTRPNARLIYFFTC